MDYNVLKTLVLGLLSKTGPMDSNSLAKELSESQATLDVHALRMALMRYYKQGLLSRQRTGGMYRYSLTERGLRRLNWLKQQEHSIE
jgi:DNA-binding transcriptional regulator PaaX